MEHYPLNPIAGQKELFTELFTDITYFIQFHGGAGGVLT
jgi:hypothetical protein